MRLPTVIFEAFEVVVVPFPSTDRDVSKRGPAVVISNKLFNESHPVTVLAMIPSAANAGWPIDVPVVERRDAGFYAESIVRMKVFTLDNGLIHGKIGALGRRDRAAVEATIEAHVPGHH